MANDDKDDSILYKSRGTISWNYTLDRIVQLGVLKIYGAFMGLPVAYLTVYPISKTHNYLAHNNDFPCPGQGHNLLLRRKTDIRHFQKIEWAGGIEGYNSAQGGS